MKTLGTILFCALTACVIVLPRNGVAQDTHYWSNQYGPKSMLLSGAVIGSVHDMSATFYNPGALGYIEQPDLLLSANAYQMESVTIQDGAGQGVDLKSSHFNLLPNMIAGAFKKSWLGKNKIAYSFLTRYRVDAEVKGGRTADIDILPDAGIEQFAGGLDEAVNAKELWAGITWARGLSSKVGVGVTSYLSVRSEGRTSNIFAQAASDSGNIALLLDINNYSASIYSLLWKAGVGINLFPLTLGVTVTTPSLQLISKGNATFNTTHVNVDTNGDSIPENSFETSFQEDVNANYKSPWSIGFGLGYFLEHTELDLSVEWFGAVDPYDVLELNVFTSQSSGQTIQRTIRQARKSVFNVAAGVEQKFGKKYSAFLAFCTDRSSFDPQSDVSVTGLDIFHVTGGASVAAGKTRWMVGLGYAWGSESQQQIIDLDPDSGGSVVNPPNDVEYDYRRLTFLVGFHVTV